MMKRLNIVNLILNFVIFVACLSFNICIFLWTKDYDINISIITVAFTLAIFIIFYLQKLFFKRYTNEIHVKLSDMLESNTNMRE
ncbi:MAG: hypothetical protein SPD90_11585 [Intestinibacter sp.]|uniref:hypothetical protein n=1 Tax=Intestinibacter sp. TaxID=1965304 RepID=UPI002A813138|nr:hypothetical protein [Intestinibacter sp.]MDY4575687.1 hypothetical protein [Intestinibacter sp.]